MDYDEDSLIEQPAIELFESMGWESCHCYDETFGAKGTLEREDRSEVVLFGRLYEAIEKLNPGLENSVISQEIHIHFHYKALHSDIGLFSISHSHVCQRYDYGQDYEDVVPEEGCSA